MVGPLELRHLNLLDHLNRLGYFICSFDMVGLFELVESFDMVGSF